MKLKYILSALFDICREYHLKQIRGCFEKGFFIFGSERIHLIGYYVFLKYGFIPDNNVKFINKIFKINKIDKQYTDINEIYLDKSFFKTWKEIGVGFNGSFNLDDDSISMSVYKKIK